MKKIISSDIKQKKFPEFKKHWIVIILVVLVLGVAALYYYKQYEQAKNLLQNPSDSVNAQMNQLVDRVGKLIVLPSEQPTLATVSDITKLQDQPFFIHAQNGDKVLLYSKANIAILYRPSINKIIQVGTLNIVSNNTISLTPVPATPSLTEVQISASPSLAPVK